MKSDKKYTSIAARVTIQEKEELEEIAEMLDMSISQVIRLCTRDFVKEKKELAQKYQEKYSI